jgi:hypothetical protein
VLYCCCPRRLLFSYEILTPAALNFFVSYAEGAVESLWSIDQYFQFVLVLMLSTGLSFQVNHGFDRVYTQACCATTLHQLPCMCPETLHVDMPLLPQHLRLLWLRLSLLLRFSRG